MPAGQVGAKKNKVRERVKLTRPKEGGDCDLPQGCLEKNVKGSNSWERKNNSFSHRKSEGKGTQILNGAASIESEGGGRSLVISGPKTIPRNALVAVGRTGKIAAAAYNCGGRGRRGP